MNIKNEDGEPGVPPTVALYSILGFWFFYAMLVTLRASVMGFEAQGAMAARRAVVTVIGIVVTWILYLCLRRFDRQPLATRIIAAFSLAAPFALATAAANFYVFNIYDPVSLIPDSDYQKYASEQGFALMQIVEDAISRYFFLAAWAGLYLALSYASEAHRVERRAARLERAAQQAELRSLRYQVNPHFLFNTLNSLSSLVMKDRRDEAEQMILSLSNFYRTSLTGDPLDDVSLEEEVHLQKLYLDIESVRFPDRLSTSIQIPHRLLMGDRSAHRPLRCTNQLVAGIRFTRLILIEPDELPLWHPDDAAGDRQSVGNFDDAFGIDAIELRLCGIGHVDARTTFQCDCAYLQIVEVVVEGCRVQCQSPVEPSRLSAQLECGQLLRPKLVEFAAGRHRDKATTLEAGGDASVQHHVVAGGIFQIQAPGHVVRVVAVGQLRRTVLDPRGDRVHPLFVAVQAQPAGSAPPFGEVQGRLAKKGSRSFP